MVPWAHEPGMAMGGMSRRAGQAGGTSGWAGRAGHPGAFHQQSSSQDGNNDGAEVFHNDDEVAKATANSM